MSSKDTILNLLFFWAISNLQRETTTLIHVHERNECVLTMSFNYTEAVLQPFKWINKKAIMRS